MTRAGRETPPAAGVPPPGASGAPSRRLDYGWILVLALGITETTSWGILYYAFAVFLTPMEAELGWSRAAMTGAFSASLLLYGAAAVPIGRWLDRRGARLIMTLGSCAGTLLLLAWSTVRDLAVFYLVWAGMGVAMAAVLYEPAFAVLTKWFEERRAQAITALTLMGGLASTIFLPLAAWLVEAQGWRGALVTLAAILAVVTIPPHALLLRGRPAGPGRAAPGRSAPRQAGSGGGVAADPPSSRAVFRLPGFGWLAAAFCLNRLVTVAVAVHLVAYLRGRGYDPAFAATAAGLIGAMQVVGRLFFVPLGRLLPQRAVPVLILLLEPAGLAVLLALPPPAGLYTFVALFGAGRGLGTLARANLVADLYGPAHYGTISGVLALLVTLAQAAGPVGAGAAYDRLGRYEPILWALALLGIAGALAAGRAQRPGAAAGPTGRATS